MNALLDTYQLLAVALTAFPLLCLAAAVAAFDLFWAEFASLKEADINYESEPLDMALQVTRSAFPDIYAEAVESIRAGAAYQALDRLICQAISAKGIPLENLDTIHVIYVGQTSEYRRQILASQMLHFGVLRFGAYS